MQRTPARGWDRGSASRARARIEGMLASVALARRGWQLVAVFVLALAVVGMHSLGAGHHGATTPVGHGSHHAAAGAAVEAHDHPLATSSGMDHHATDAAAPTVAQEAMTSSVMATCIGCSASGDAMGAMCLAVVSSLLALALLLFLRHLLRGRPALTLPAWVPSAMTPRSPLRRMALSPIEVCVLRT